MPASPRALAGTGRDGVYRGKEVGHAVGREGEDLLHGVNRPAQDELLCAPGGIASAELFQIWAPPV